MLQIKNIARATALAFGSLSLLIVSYVLVWSGVNLSNPYSISNRYSEGALLLGLTVYFVSLYIAVYSRMRWLPALVIGLGGLQGVFLVVVCAHMFITDLSHPGFPILALSTLAVYIGGFAALMRRKRLSAS